MHQYTIRALQSKDKEQWRILWQEYLGFYQTQLSEDVTEHTLEKLLSDDKNSGCLVACDTGDKPVAFLNYIVQFTTWSTKPECYLHDLYVLPVFRKAGIAKLMISTLKVHCDAEDYGTLYWITKPDNTTARTVYDSIAKGSPWIMYIMK
jgi:ribosomal protein S18 acetylase RimI-like enzyme